MQVKPEELALAIRMVELKPEGSERQWSWNVKHRLVAKDGELILKTTGKTVSAEWHVRAVDAVDSWEVNVRRGPLSHMRHVLTGGRFSITRDQENKLLIFSKRNDQDLSHVTYRLPYEESESPYPDPWIGEDLREWTFATPILAAAFRFIARFADMDSTKQDTACATLYEDGKLITGRQGLIALAEKVLPKKREGTSAEHLSFNIRTAHLAAKFLERLGPTVEVSVAPSGGGTRLHDPNTGNKFWLPGTDGQFRTLPAQLDRRWKEVIWVDAKWLRKSTTAFLGLATNPTSARLGITLRGEGEQASIILSTREENHLRVSESEFRVHRELTSGVEAKETIFDLSGRQVLRILGGVEDKCVYMAYDGTIVTIADRPLDISNFGEEEQVPSGESDSDEELSETVPEDSESGTNAPEIFQGPAKKERQPRVHLPKVFFLTGEGPPLRKRKGAMKNTQGRGVTARKIPKKKIEPEVAKAEREKIMRATVRRTGSGIPGSISDQGEAEGR